jgi:ATP-dependent DNA ligase
MCSARSHVPAEFNRNVLAINVARSSGPGWAHELKHDGYRLQIHIRDGRVRLFTRNGADWSKRYPLIVWIKVKNPKEPAATRAIDGTF